MLSSLSGQFHKISIGRGGGGRGERNDFFLELYRSDRQTGGVFDVASARWVVGSRRSVPWLRVRTSECFEISAGDWCKYHLIDDVD